MSPMDRQTEILQFLEQGAVEIAKVFKAGCILRNDESFPARAYFVAHAVREIINKLPEYYRAETSESASSSMKPKRPTQLRQLADDWFSATSSYLSPSAPAGAPTAEPPLVAIPMYLATKLHALVTYEVGVKDARRRRFAAFLGQVRGVDPAEMMVTADSFIDIDASGRAHMPSPEDLWDERKALDLWDQLEERLYAVIGKRHEIYADINSAVEELNAI